MIESCNYLEQITLTADLPDLSFYTDHPCLDITLCANDEELLSGRYHAYNGMVEVADVASLFESFGRSSDPMLIECVLTAENVEADESMVESFTLLFCSRHANVADPRNWLLENFLTFTPVRRIAPGGFANVAWYAAARESVRLDLVIDYLDDSGTRRSYRHCHSGNGLASFTTELRRTIVPMQEAERIIREKCSVALPTLISVTFLRGRRSATFYIDAALEGVVPFYYYNCFGITDHIALPGKTTRRLASESTVADLGQRSMLYDVTHRLEFDTESAPLTEAEQRQVEEMLTSPEVLIAADPSNPDLPIYDTDIDSHTQILVTANTMEFPDDADQLPTAKFTWRFAANGLRATLS